MTLDQVPLGSFATIEHVGGQRAFRRRLLELGLLPGVRVDMLRRAPLGDPIEVRARHTTLSIRLNEAREIQVTQPGQE